MKATKLMMAALTMGALAFAACGHENPDEPDPVIPTPTEETTPDEEDIEVRAGYYAICFQPAEGTVCNDIYFVGNYEASNWTLDAANIKMEKMEKFAGWYLAYIPVLADGTALAGKPIQAKADGTLSWDFQTGDENSWTLVCGDVTIEAGYAGESNLTYNDPTKPVIYKSSSWKNGKTPCVEAEKFDYAITAKFPAGVPAAGIEAMGSFDGWSTGVVLTLVEGTTYTCTINAEADAEFKFRQAGSWDNEVEAYDAENDTWGGMPNMKFGELAVEGKINLDYSDATKYRWKVTE